MTKERRLTVIRLLQAKSNKEQQEVFSNLQVMMNSKCPKGCEHIYKEFSEIKEIMIEKLARGVK